MKNTILLICSVLLMMNLSAQTFPGSELTDYNLSFTISDTLSYTPDDNLFCDSVFFYQVKALIPMADEQWYIDQQTCQSYNPGPPASIFCDLLGAYQAQSVNDVLALYAPEDNAGLASYFSVDSLRNRFVDLINHVVSFDLKMGYSVTELPGVMAWIVDVGYDDGTVLLTPYYLKEIEGVWYFTSVEDNSGISANLGTYLQVMEAYQMITETTDLDGDGIPNLEDNCPCSPNADQKDFDADGLGDVCDNCPQTKNPDQNDYDLDGIGDVCDNCPFEANADQSDKDGDKIGDICDNCPEVHNIDQKDLNMNGLGDACDPDIDGDGILNEDDVDIDGDDVANDLDNCPYTYNPFQSDADNDGLGANCDNCPDQYNPGQEDMDGDGIGDLCDKDRDGDGVPNESDNCPDTPNQFQEDENCDGVGDACETINTAE